MDHRLESQDNPGLTISRMLQVAMSEPKGWRVVVIAAGLPRAPPGVAA